MPTNTGLVQTYDQPPVVTSAAATTAGVIPIKGTDPKPFTSTSAPPASLKNFRGRTGTPYSSDRGADPATYIEVAQMPSTPQADANLNTIKATGVKFNSFFITDSQETDAEKADVSETFGAPHVFATGRYMRKVMISGVCRTGPVNSNPTDTTLSEQDRARFRVPNTLGLRVLYDQVLRASVQISRSQFSRLVIDGEVYCGWFTTLNISRSGTEESFAHFTMSMLVFSRYHALETEALKLFPSGLSLDTKVFSDALAAIVMKASAGTMAIKLSATTTQIAQKLSESSSGSLSFKTPVTITTEGVAQPVKVLAWYNGRVISGISLLYGNSASSRQSLDGSTLNIGTYDVAPFVHDFQLFLSALRDASSGVDGGNRNADGSLKASPPPDNSSVSQFIKFEISPAMSDACPVDLTATMTLDLTQSPVISGLSLRFGTAQEDYDAAVTLPAKTLFQTAKTSTLKMRFTLQAPGSGAINMAGISSTKVTLWEPTKDLSRAMSGPLISATIGATIQSPEKKDTDAAAKVGAAILASAPTVTAVVAATGFVELTAVFDYSQIAGAFDLRISNPFLAATDLITAFRFKLEIPGYGPVITPKVTIDAECGTTWISSVLKSIGSAQFYSTTPKDNFLATVTFVLDPVAKDQIKANPDLVKLALHDVMTRSTFSVSTGSGDAVDAAPMNDATVTYLSATAAVLTSPSKPTGALNWLKGPQTLSITLPKGFKAIPTYAPKA